MAEYIDREKLLEVLRYNYRPLCSTGSLAERFYNSIVHTINEQPTAEVEEVRHGTDVGDMSESDEWYASVHVCGECGCNWMVYITQDSHYCPHCGAKMDGGKAE
jgi:rubrerythrin